MIRSLSPYYITTPLVSPATGLTCTQYTLYIKVWDGLVASIPSEVSYQITKENNILSTGNDVVNISRLISDFIEFIPQSATTTSVINGVNQRWVQTYTTYTTTDSSDATTEQNTFIDLMSLGYSYGYEGVNNDIVNESTLIPTQEYKVYRDGFFIVPVLLDQSAFTSSAISVRSYPNLQINISPVVTSLFLISGELVKYIWVELSEASTDRYVEVIYKGETTTLFIEDECKYTPINICFQNKDGALQNITFFKESIESMTTTSNQFERSSLQPSDGYHQFVRFDVQGRTSFTANSGYIDEDNNEVFRQMLLSEKIWIYENSQFTPVNMSTKNITYQTRQKERLINYEIKLDYSYNQINNV